MKPETEHFDSTITRVTKILAWAGVFVVLIFFTAISGCTIYSNSVEAEQTLADTEFAKENKNIIDSKNKAILDLVSKGVNPMLARCSIMGWDTINERIMCKELADQQHIRYD